MHVEVNPKVLEWAVRQSLIPEAELIKKMPNLPAWLSGEKLPTVVQLETLASQTHVPFGYLMLQEVPSLPTTKIHDFRTKGSHGVGEYSRNLRDTIQQMKERQEWLHEYKKEESYAEVSFVGSLTKSLSKDMFLQKMHEVISVGTDWYEEVKSKEEAFRFLRDHVEAAGVIVFVNSLVGNDTHRRLNVEEFRGFALSDNYAPLIFINGADAPAGRTFTLIHEMVHLFLGRDGLDDGTETFCNEVAAAFLVPKAVFLEQWEKSSGTFGELENYFKVSLLVLYRLALTYRKISKETYREYVAAYNKRMAQVKKTGGMADFYRVQPNRAGRSFSQYVFSAVQEGRVLYREAYRLLGLHGKAFQKLMQKTSEV